MDKKGISLTLTVIIVFISLAIVLFASMVFYFGSLSELKAAIGSLIEGVTDQIKGLADLGDLGGGGLSKAEEEARRTELNVEALQDVKELKEKTVDMHQLLIDGAKLVKTGDGGSKNTDYDNAIDKYVKYYKECERLAIEYRTKFVERAERDRVESPSMLTSGRIMVRAWILGDKWEGVKEGLRKEWTPTPAEELLEQVWISFGNCGTVKKEGIKFRILNALREKYFVNPEKEIEERDFNIVSEVEITSDKLRSAIIKTKIAAYIKLDNLDKALEYMNKPKVYDLFDKSGYYDLVIIKYYWIKRYIQEHGEESEEVKELCEEVLKFNDKPTLFINKYLSAFELAEYPVKENGKDVYERDESGKQVQVYEKQDILEAEDYKFISIPKNDIKSLC